MDRDVFDFLKMNDVEYSENASMADISPIRIGGCASAVVYPSSDDRLITLLRFLQEAKIKYKILGRMSNVLPPDEKYDGVVIRTDRIKDFCIEGNSLCASAGVSLPSVSIALQKAGLSGFEGLSGIPGSIGGALVGNAGAFGCEISNSVKYINVFSLKESELVRLTPAQCNFAYRDSAFKSGEYVILSACFSLAYSDGIAIKNRMDGYKKKRRRSQPTDKPSLGSTFKRPGGNNSAAELVDNCGLKGYAVGGAKISEKHAGFIINIGGATAADYIALSDFAARRVYEKYGVCLEREVEII